MLLKVHLQMSRCFPLEMAATRSWVLAGPAVCFRQAGRSPSALERAAQSYRRASRLAPEQADGGAVVLDFVCETVCCEGSPAGDVLCLCIYWTPVQVLLCFWDSFFVGQP